MRSAMFSARWIGAALWSLAAAGAAAPALGADVRNAASDGAIADFTLNDALGAKRSLSQWSEARAIVVVFLGTECPLAKLYGKKLAEMDEAYAARGVQL
ncbi:MAG TPA: redoxin domain-containing protein, partial [Lacipirellulaceae bacterium]|nr:redoxin domain-containing protein [Lacipirellulaceae bacterium]